MGKGVKIVVSIVLGLLAALFGMIYLQGQKDMIVGSAALVEVYVSAGNIPANVPLTPDMLATKEVPQAYVQPGVIKKSEMIDPSTIRGVTLVPIKEGEQILRTKLWDGSTPPLSNEVPANMVAVTIEFKADAPNVHANLQPRDRVDILAALHFQKPDGERFLEVRPLFYSVEVIAVDQDTPQSLVTQFSDEGVAFQKEARSIGTATVLLGPTDAQQLILAQQLGDIWFTLRGPEKYDDYRYETWNQDRFLESQFRLWDAAAIGAQTARELARSAARR